LSQRVGSMNKESVGIKSFSGQWTSKHLRHLLRRTLFGVSLKDISFFEGKSLDECVDILLSPSQSPEPLLNHYHDPEVPLGKPVVFSSYGKGDAEKLRIAYLKAWWVGVIINQERSITEKMVLFWHNHFAVEFNNVKDSRYAYRYLDTMRKHAMGNFRELTREVTIDPCMLVYLNGNLNNKGAPNENYGRELQELFTVGKGPDSHYSEVDVKMAAKVLSGWKDDKVKIESYFDPGSHDPEVKTFSGFYQNHEIKGRTGEDGAKEKDDLINMIFAQREVSRFFCRKLYRWFVNSNIDEAVENNVITPLAELLVKSDYDVKPVLKAILTSDFFYEPFLLGGMIKAPTDFFVGLFREFGVVFSDDKEKLSKQYWRISVLLGQLGQDLGDPPAVAGWPAYYEYPIFYKDWINSEMLSIRDILTRLLSFPTESDKTLMFDFSAFARGLKHPESPKALLAESIDLCCGIVPGPTQMAYIEKVLSNDLGNGPEWTELWPAHIADANNAEVADKVKHRLAKVFGIIFALPEFQLM